ncbi:MAG: hypothetical protein GEU75_16375 [Dehalococcoidia bacterium]|nr:hypothetical protein [Dehalococcoidia bacterium]
MKLNLLTSILLAVLALTLGGGATSFERAKEAEAAFPAAEFTSPVQMYCLPDNTVSVVLRWTTNRVGPQWVDLSLFNNNFAEGTFLGNGPLFAGQSGLVWNGLLPATWHFLRVNTLTPFGWFPSETKVFYTRDDCSFEESLLSIPPPPACLEAPPAPSIAGCVWTAKPDFASYAVGETVAYCYWVNQAMNVRIVVTKPDGTKLVVIDRFDEGIGACVGPYQAAEPLGLRIVQLYGGPGDPLLAETHFLVP